MVSVRRQFDSAWEHITFYIRGLVVYVIHHWIHCSSFVVALLALGIIGVRDVKCTITHTPTNQVYDATLVAKILLILWLIDLVV